MADKVRVWVYFHCWTKVTVHKGRSVQFSMSAPTEEGYSFHEEKIMFDGTFLRRYINTGGCDCDGPIERFSHKWCHYLNKKDKPLLCGNVVEHNWKTLHRYQRDRYAEQMGY